MKYLIAALTFLFSCSNLPVSLPTNAVQGVPIRACNNIEIIKQKGFTEVFTLHHGCALYGVIPIKEDSSVIINGVQAVYEDDNWYCFIGNDTGYYVNKFISKYVQLDTICN